MGKKDPIPFQQKKRERTGRPGRKGAPKPRSGKKPGPPNRPVSTPRGAGETQEVRLYWSHFIRQPFAGPGRFLWTERMLWGNALIAAVLTTIGITIEIGFSLLTMISVFINAFFLFFLVYYLFPWVADWVFRKLKVYASSVDGLKLEMIVLSGWLVIVSLMRLVPFYYPLPYWTAALLFGVLMLIAVHRRVRSSWGQAALATAAGGLAVAVVMLILSTF